MDKERLGEDRRGGNKGGKGTEETEDEWRDGKNRTGRKGKDSQRGEKGKEGKDGRERWRKVRHAENLAPTAIYKSRRLYMSTAASITVCVCLRERNNAY